MYQAGLVGHCILEVVACSDGGMKDSPVNSGGAGWALLTHAHSVFSQWSIEQNSMARTLEIAAF